MSRRRWLAAAGLVLLVLVIAELAAPWVAQRALERALPPCVAIEEVEFTNLSRPLLPQLLVGRAHDVEVAASGVEVADLRVDQVTVALPEVVLPWGFGTAEPLPAAQVQARITATDARAQLWAVTPFGLRPTLRFEGGEVVVGAPGLGLDARFVPTVTRDRVALVPALGPPSWWTSLGLALAVELPDGVDIERIEVGEGLVRVRGSVALEVYEPGTGGVCEEPIASASNAHPPRVHAAASWTVER
ncbi:MAG: hypothetical protein R6V28_06495 [Nitriliruptoraceae bacterium]